MINYNLRQGLRMGKQLQINGGGDGGRTGILECSTVNPSFVEAGSKLKSFDDVLKYKAYQSEFDKRVAKALKTAKGKLDVHYKMQIEETKAEVEKLAQIKACKNAKDDYFKKFNELMKREENITIRELKVQAYGILLDRGLPRDLGEILNYSDEEACYKSIDIVENAFNLAIEKAVLSKLRDVNMGVAKHILDLVQEGK